MSQGRFYTADYLGEMVSVNTSWRDRKDPSTMTWVEKTIFNEDHDNIAHVIGNSKSRLWFDLNLLNGQTGGEKVRSVGQTYGCNLLYKDFNPTFLICTNTNICDKLAKQGYGDDNIVFTNVKNILQHPGQFHLYPQLYSASAGNLALRLACADGHKTVYMIGMDTYFQPNDNVYCEDYGLADVQAANNKFITENCKTFLTYSDVQFYYVSDKATIMPEQYNWCPNVKKLEWMEYVNLASLGAIAH